MRRQIWFVMLVLMLAALLAGCRPAPADIPSSGAVVRVVYFYSSECEHCQEIQNEVLGPLQEEMGERLDILWVEIGAPRNYELFIRAGEFFGLSPQERELPTLVVDEQIFVGADAIRQDFPCLLDICLAAGGTTWPDIPGLQEYLSGTGETPETGAVTPAAPDNPFLGPPIGGEGTIEGCTVVGCTPPAPIRAAFFYQVGCQECSVAEYDIRYIQSRYPQLIVDRFNIYDDLPLAQYLAGRVGRADELHTPAFFVGDDALIGQEEITPQNLAALMEKYTATGVDAVWETAEPPQPQVNSLPLLTVMAAGLIDGLNPCAFATLVFLIAYLAAGERKGREILLVGGLFSLGVFVAYLLVGLGLYRLLDLLGSLLTTLGRWLYGLTALFCAVLAVFSFLDFIKARRGQIEDMSLSLPAALRNRVRAVIRQGQKARVYFAAAFVTGLVVSLLELACTGQIYLPTIIFIASNPATRALGASYLLLYNLFFIVPLVVVFVLSYFGTTSAQLGLFLKKRTATIKLGSAVLFAALAAWLAFSLLG